MANRNTIWYGVADPVTASGATTTITLQDDVYVYPVTVEADTEIVFDTSELTAPGVDPEKWGTQFYLLLTMGSTVHSVAFPSSVTWNCNIGPTLNAASKKYLVRFDTVGANVTIGNYDGSINA